MCHEIHGTCTVVIIPSIVIAVNKGMIEFTMIINLFQVLDLLTQSKDFGAGEGI